MNPYSLILDALFYLNDLDSHEEQERYLASLRPAARALWQAYRPTGNRHVAVNYGDPATQAVYMIRYFPPYSQIIRFVLARLNAAEMPLFHQELISATFLGSGPAPELFGFFCFLRRHCPSVKMVVAHLLDAAHDGWECARTITTKVLLPALWDKDLFEIRSERMDLSDPLPADALHPTAPSQKRIKQSTLVVIQNCLNEIAPYRYPTVQTRIIGLLRSMDAGKILVAIERTGYPESVALLQAVAQQAEKEKLGAVLLRADDSRAFACTAVLDRMPKIITDNLLVRRRGYGDIGPNEHGLVCSSTVRFHELVITRL